MDLLSAHSGTLALLFSTLYLFLRQRRIQRERGDDY